jgi:reactive chlorine resistance protein C
METLESSVMSNARNATRSTAVIRPERLQAIGAFVLRYGLVFVLALWGSAKWTQAEAESIQPLVAHSPVMSWIYRVMSVQHGSELIGLAELVFAGLILLRRWFPKASAIGSVGCILMFLTTLSFLLTTPGLDEGTKGFLVKDVFLLGAAIWTAGEAWQADLQNR